MKEIDSGLAFFAYLEQPLIRLLARDAQVSL